MITTPERQLVRQSAVFETPFRIIVLNRVDTVMEVAHPASCQRSPTNGLHGFTTTAKELSNSPAVKRSGNEPKQALDDPVDEFKQHGFPQA